MSDYTQATDFASKDALPAGNAEKAISGADIDGEFSLISTAIASKIDEPASPSTAEVLYYDGAWTAKDLGADGTAGQIFRTDGTNADWGSATTGNTYASVGTGTSATFTPIPSWVTCVAVQIVGASFDTTSTALVFQPGDSGGAQTTGYQGSSTNQNATANTDWSSDGYVQVGLGGGASGAVSGVVLMTLADSSTNTWTIQTQAGRNSSSQSYTGGGIVALDSALTQVTIGPANGTDSFDAGSWSIRYW